MTQRMAVFLPIFGLAALWPGRAPAAAAEATTGPIVFALYTLHKGILKMITQLRPAHARGLHAVTLSVERDGKWETVASSEVTSPAWTAHFRIEGWDDTHDTRYRVAAGQQTFDGTIRRDPVDKRVIAAATFTGNSDGPGGGHVSRQDIVDAVRAGGSGREGRAELPVIQVIDEDTSETVYTLRIPEDGFRPPVFTSGPHTLRVAAGGKTTVRTGLRASGQPGRADAAE